jgi:putative PIN family toxin of toxin-antitoxin system
VSIRDAVFDTNVLVSGVLSPHGPPGRIVDWLQQRSVRAVVDERCLAEYEDVLERPELGLPPEEVEIFLTRLRKTSLHVEVAPEETVLGLPDPDDAPFLECAIAAGCPLVTGNLRHFPAKLARGVELLTPAEFVEQVVAGG